MRPSPNYQTIGASRQPALIQIKQGRARRGQAIETKYRVIEPEPNKLGGERRH